MLNKLFLIRISFKLDLLLLFQSEDTILKYMNEWNDSGKPNRKPFVILSTKIPYTPKQISHQ